MVLQMMIDSIPAIHTIMFKNSERCLDSTTADEGEKYGRIFALMAAELRQSKLAVDQCSSSKIQRELLTLELRQKQHDFDMKLKADREAKSPEPKSTDPTDRAAETP